jgi:hypothetical protein
MKSKPVKRIPKSKNPNIEAGDILPIGTLIFYKNGILLLTKNEVTFSSWRRREPMLIITSWENHLTSNFFCEGCRKVYLELNEAEIILGCKLIKCGACLE